MFSSAPILLRSNGPLQPSQGAGASLRGSPVSRSSPRAADRSKLWWLADNNYNNPSPGGLLLRHRRPAQRRRARCSRRQLQPVRPLSDRSHRRGQRSRLLRLRRWPDAARRPDAAGSSRRSTSTAPGVSFSGMARPRQSVPTWVETSGDASNSPAISDPPAPGLISLDSDGGATPVAVVYPSANNEVFYTESPQTGQSELPVVPARRYQQSAPWLRGGQESEPPRCPW